MFHPVGAVDAEVFEFDLLVMKDEARQLAESAEVEVDQFVMHHVGWIDERARLH